MNHSARNWQKEAVVFFPSRGESVVDFIGERGGCLDAPSADHKWCSKS